jgi:predicted PilT family ATPase
MVLSMWRKKKKMKLENVEVNLTLPGIGGVKGKWAPNDSERLAAWELYVELVTRISVVELKDKEGILREALNSLYSVFQITREILRKYGPEVAIPLKKDEFSFGKLAIMILNYQLRPFLTKWHPLLQEYESKRKPEISIKEHEDRWERNEEMRKELEKVRKTLIEYSILLAKVANVEPFFKSTTNKLEES